MSNQHQLKRLTRKVMDCPSNICKWCDRPCKSSYCSWEHGRLYRHFRTNFKDRMDQLKANRPKPTKSQEKAFKKIKRVLEGL